MLYHIAFRRMPASMLGFLVFNCNRDRGNIATIAPLTLFGRIGRFANAYLALLMARCMSDSSSDIKTLDHPIAKAVL